jgi:hypothetical protein
VRWFGFMSIEAENIDRGLRERNRRAGICETGKCFYPGLRLPGGMSAPAAGPCISRLACGILLTG